MKKSRFLAFIFAFIPGAGQMYLGFMKRGVSLMLAFSVVVGASAFFSIPLFTVLLPIIWFYAFFDTFNLNGLTYEQRLYTEDKFLFHLDGALGKNWAAMVARRHTLVGVVLIILGLNMLYNMFRHYLWEYFDRFPLLAQLLDNLPTLVVGIAIIGLGLYLVFGKKSHQKSLPGDDFVQYGGDKRHE